jgi:chemotaxis protein methyltransferase CheR
VNLEAGPEVERFRAVVADRLGLSFEDDKLGWLREVLARRSGKTRLQLGEYVDRLQRTDRAEELGNLAQELTITETYFFRHSDQLRAFSEIALLPWWRSPTEPVRILSAGCASGEEPYSLAMLAREHLPETAAGLVSITALDVNARMLERAAKARYSAWSLRETSQEMRERWFRAEGNEVVLDSAIRGMVRFEQRNLKDEDPAFWRRATFHVVLCRNVLMYFTRDAARAVVRRIAESLVPSGLLFLGHAETLRGLSRDFHLCHTHDTFYYRRRETLGPMTSSIPPSFASAGLEAPGESWVDAIQRSVSRITRLTEPPADVVAEIEALAKPVAAWDATHAARLVHEDRLSEARDLLPGDEHELDVDPDRLLLRAVLLTQAGDVSAAERVCKRLLRMDESSPGARYLMALCRESAGDRAGATEQDLIALHTDPSFAMPRLHLGLLARQAGDLTAARREFAQALALLEREESSRVLLFGGGFTREALLGLCRAELVACGGAA